MRYCTLLRIAVFMALKERSALGFHWLAKKGPRLKVEHLKAQLQWAIARKDWTVENFQRMISSNECRVEQQPAG